jgi:hypothetical protein
VHLFPHQPCTELFVGSNGLIEALREGGQATHQLDSLGRIGSPVVSLPEKEESHGGFPLLDRNSTQEAMLFDP